MRLFIAVNFSAGTRARLTALRDELRSRSERGSFSAPENLHLTLAFLGECDARQTAAAKQILNATHFEPFDLKIGGVGRFKQQKADILYTMVEKTPQLFNLQRSLYDNLNVRGFSLDSRKFKPHITLGREVVTGAAPWRIEPFGETINSIDLMKSERVGGKLVYTAIYSKNCKI